MRIDPRWWMRAGERDLAMAAQLHSGGFHEGTAFHCQQAAEKMLKALAARLLGDVLRTHSCIELLEALARSGLEAPSELCTSARKLDLHYIDSRYPNSVGGAPDRFYDETIAAEALEACLAIHRFVEERLA